MTIDTEELAKIIDDCFVKTMEEMFPKEAKELDEMARICYETDCLFRSIKVIPIESIKRYNELCRKHFASRQDEEKEKEPEKDPNKFRFGNICVVKVEKKTDSD